MWHRPRPIWSRRESPRTAPRSKSTVWSSSETCTIRSTRPRPTIPTWVGRSQFDSSALFDLLADPMQFPRLAHRPPHDYAVSPGRYLMLGDNSPWSRDARAWGRIDQIDPNLPGQGWDDSGRSSWEVPESLLVGKAFCVYWPHPKPVWPKLSFGADIRLPILPYIEQMRWIR